MPKKNSSRLFGGIDIGGTKILAIIADEHGNVLSSSKKKTKAETGFKNICERAVDALKEAASSKAISFDQLVAAGVVVPTPVTPNGIAIAAPNLPGWINVPLVKTMEKLTSVKFFAANDCNAGAYGEYIYGAGKDSKTLVGLFVGTGLGGGVVFHNQLIVGENHMAAELGHMIVQEGGRICGCGHHGCLEAYASKTGMAKKIAWEIHLQGKKSCLTELCPDFNYATIKSSLLQESYKKGDSVTVEAVNEAAHYLGVGVANFITLFGPDCVVIGGGVFEVLGKELLPLVKESAKKRTWPEPSFKNTKILLAKLGDYSVPLGAVAYARNMLDGGLNVN